MTKSDIATVIGILKVAYPHYYKNKEDIVNATELWFEIFQNDDIELLKLAVKRFITTDTSGFPPTIGQIKEQMYKLTTRNERTAIEAWDEAVRMLSNGIYMTQKQFDMYCPDVRAFFGRVQQVREMAQIDSETINTVTKGQFLKQYEALKVRDKEYQMLPENMKNTIGKIAEKLSIGV